MSDNRPARYLSETDLKRYVPVHVVWEITLACERLHLSQSALSLTIKALEEGLGGRLFTRNLSTC